VRAQEAEGLGELKEETVVRGRGSTQQTYSQAHEQPQSAEGSVRGVRLSTTDMYQHQHCRRQYCILVSGNFNTEMGTFPSCKGLTGSGYLFPRHFPSLGCRTGFFEKA
jgi:hypothetical protein